MAVKNLQFQNIDDWAGVSTLDNKENLPPQVWFACTNVVVSSSGSALVLRSPLTITNTIGNPTARFVSMFNAFFAATQIIFADIQTAGTTNVSTYRFDTQFFPPAQAMTLTRSGQANHRIDRVNANNRVYNLNGTETFQYTNVGASFQFQWGIGRPALAPTLSIVAGGALTINVGVTASYAYRNATTTHVGQCSLPSAVSGVTNGGNQTLRIPVVAATTTGVDGIVLFLSKDGESNRYLNVDVNGNMIVYANATANIDLTAAYYVDTNTPETAYNSRPLDTGTQVSAWQDRMWITGFGAPNSIASGTLGQQIIYSGYESVYIGVPQEAFPALNVVTIPAKTEYSQVTIPTPVGLLCFSNKNAYLLTGNPQDNLESANNTLTVTAQLDSLDWNIGTQSPQSVVSTPYGIIWLDDNKRIQMWPYQGYPVEIGLPIRNELELISGSSVNLYRAEATWFHGGAVQYYILAGCTDSALAINNRLFIIGFYKDPATGNTVQACSLSDISAACIITATNTQIIAEDMVLIAGTTDVVQRIFDFDTAGSGFGAGTTISFDLMAGNNIGNYSMLHSLRFDSNASDVQVLVADADGSNMHSIPLQRDGSTTYKGYVGKYGIRQMIRFLFSTNDAIKREVINLRLAYSKKQRVL